jgi:spoIIIJ-associated protein
VVADEAAGLPGFGPGRRAVIIARPAAGAPVPARAAAPEERREIAPVRVSERRQFSDGTRGRPTELSDRARENLAGILARMGAGHAIDVEGGETENAIELEVRTDTQGLLTGEGGEVLEALTYLVNRMTNKGAQDAKRVVIEAEGYRSDRVASLEHLALTMADKVRASGRPVALDPMNSYDRRIIHVTLEKVAGVATESEGTGSLKRIVIRPAAD